MSLRTRIQLSITFLLVILLLIANTTIYLMFKNASIKSEQELLQSTASHIIEELNKGGNSTNEEVLHTFLISDGVIRLVNRKGDSDLNLTRENSYKKIQTSFRNDQFEGVLTYNGSKFILVSTPIIHDNGSIVNLQIIQNADGMFSNLEDLKGVLVFTSFLVIGILCIAGWVLGGVITRPIHRFISTMKTIEEEESYQQIEITKSKRDELNQLGMTFNSMMRKLEDSYLKQEQFVSDASHELKTPLTVISGYVSLLKRWGSTRPEVLEEAINSIESESARMKFMTEQLLQLASAEKLGEFAKERMDIVPIVGSTIERLSRTYKNEIIWTTEPKQIVAEIHEQSFVQLLVILLDNANKYSNDVIQVKLREQEGCVELSITDKGIGIPGEAQPYIFDRMYRVDKNRSRKSGGTGLGLFIAKRISERHGGSISLISKEGHGTTFIVSLPISEVQ
ncbi:ATP-binding protein [Virgibacillus siamensis]|uniref:ATP-binding protein n=1 Tax=Virgibacillus siamensis TaxID=480071 RepID=UPI000985FD42|nr:ATP-binding protein [Virgibacillus siamensis]